MKINQTGLFGVNPYKKQMDKTDHLKQTSKKQDKVEISSAAKEMQQASQLSAARQEKIDALKQQIQNGGYEVDFKATAKGIVDFYSKNN